MRGGGKEEAVAVQFFMKILSISNDHFHLEQ